ncbi:MAG: hypothetical protein GF399_02595 [Candidatus Coatesbacteria bacterium]|nr:hypothetical protein [Candidatus Coatesbacteria bacterium]
MIHRSTALLLLIVMIGVPWAQGELVDQVVCIVNDEVVLASELGYTVRSYLSGLAQQPSGEELNRLTGQMFIQLVTTKVLVQEAERRGMSVTYRELDQAVADQLRQAQAAYPSAEAFHEALAAADLTEARLEDLYRIEAREQMLINQLLRDEYNHRINITEDDIDAYLAENELTTEERTVLELRIVSVEEKPGPDTEAAVEELAYSLMRRAVAGEDFLELAEEYGGTAGDMGIWRRGELDPVFEEAAFALKPGEVSEPVRTRAGWHVIKLLQRIDDETAHLAQIQLPVEATAEDRDAARSELNEVRSLLETDPGAKLQPDPASYLDVEEVRLNLSDIQRSDPLLAQTLTELEPGGLTRVQQYEGALSFMQLVSRRETSAQNRERVRQLILDEELQARREEWVKELLSEAYIDVKIPDLRGILPDGPGRR